MLAVLLLINSVSAGSAEGASARSRPLATVNYAAAGTIISLAQPTAETTDHLVSITLDSSHGGFGSQHYLGTIERTSAGFALSTVLQSNSGFSVSREPVDSAKVSALLAAVRSRATSVPTEQITDLTNFRAFPARLREQPIFYPVLTGEYAIQIARDWNVKESGRGYVTRLAVDSDFLSRYEAQRVGSDLHLEYWVPAGQLEEFNRNILGQIEVIHEFVRTDG